MKKHPFPELENMYENAIDLIVKLHMDNYSTSEEQDEDYKLWGEEKKKEFREVLYGIKKEDIVVTKDSHTPSSYLKAAVENFEEG